ncbi:MAG: Rne/Rng family ribonuclease [Rhizobiales bacterium]|nr:Rne/Rng family ribonuclease [Hyphomicrobiales bacterium]
MTTRMLIDSTHPEETRVVVQRGNRVEEFDFESAQRRPLRGNIYLAKVTRVEPSLQAAFVDFGGNRHGFLAFSEIHPDYYQIPVADREALLAEEAAAAAHEESEDDERASRRGGRSAKPRRRRGGEDKVASAPVDETGEPAEETASAENQDASEPDDSDSDHAAESESEVENGSKDAEDVVEQLGGGGDAMEEVPQRRAPRSRRSYKIQEVIRRRQILLVQVVKEERGNKGAALTTYLSLAGRYSVLMPNTARGGGISRKITNSADRKRLKTLATDLEVPDGMGVILRTAGASRTKTEIKRDFEYLMRMWESVRTLTLESTAPALVYEEGSLIKRAIRDLYSKDIEEILVGGEEGYREAKDFMRMLMPSHSKAVQPYRESTPLFTRYGVEAQLDSMFSHNVTLKSGGYIVINQTEALVSIDVNSGRSTREHNIEDTALKTNLEAAEEVARQLRLRDLAGLIVIDFIDMEEKRNNRAVERKLNDCLTNDRARIQVGRISHFGLLEMSRQRIRTGVLESSSVPCPHCAGTGLIRSTSSLSLSILRSVEEQLVRNAGHDITIRTRMEVALYLLNHKRETIRALEARFGVTITVEVGTEFPVGQHYLIERGETATRRISADVIEAKGPAPAEPEEIDEPIEDEEEDSNELEEGSEGSDGDESRGEGEPRGEGNGEKRRRRRRRRRGRGGREDGRDGDTARENGATRVEAVPDESEGADEDDSNSESESDEGSAEEKRRRRRRRGGRRNRRDREPRDTAPLAAGESEAIIEAVAEPVTETAPAAVEDVPAIKPKRGRAKKAATTEAPAEVADAEAAPEPVAEKPAKAPRSRKKVAPAEPASEAAPEVKAAPATAEAQPAPAPLATPVAQQPEPEPEDIVDPNRPKRSGWWAKAKSALGG